MLLTFLEERDLPRRGRQARDWLTHDERGRIVGLVAASIAMSLAMSLLAYYLVALVSRRRGASPDVPAPIDVEDAAEGAAGGAAVDASDAGPGVAATADAAVEPSAARA